MDTATQTFYANGATASALRYEQADVQSLHNVLRSLAASGVRALEVGGGSGRDAAFLVELGCDTSYTDGCREMMIQAVGLHPQLMRNSRVAAFPLLEDDPLLDERFDLVLCVAVIMHLDDGYLVQLASQLARITRPRGHLVLSHSLGHEGLTGKRDTSGRLFVERSAESVARVFEDHGFEVTQQSKDSDGMGRQSIRWMIQVLQQTT